ncbi:MAG: hemolysin family protein [Lysobacteraceae bacterium]
MTRLLIVFVLVLLNGFFAMSEMAVMTSRRSRLKQMAQDSRRAMKALHLAEHPEGFLSAVQLWITLLGLLTGYFGGESVGGEIEGPIASIPMLAPYAHNIGFVAGFVVMVFLYGVIGELLPKRIATLAPERLATYVAYPIHVLATVAMPGVWLLSTLTSALLRLFGLRKSNGDHVSTDEIRMLVAEGHEQGVFADDERNMMNRVLRLGDRTADSMMTPRTQIAWLDANANIEQNMAVIRETTYSQYPVYRGSDREVLGVLEMKTLAGRLGETDADLFRDLRDPVFVADSTRSLALLEIFRDEKQSLALVVDEYGEIQGLVTLEDLMDAIIGRLQSSDTSDPDDMAIVQRDDGSWLVDGSLATDDLRELLSLYELPDEDEHDYNTLAGMVIAQFGRIPHVGESFEWKDLRFEVIDLDGARIDKLLIKRIPQIDLPDKSG